MKRVKYWVWGQALLLLLMCLGDLKLSGMTIPRERSRSSSLLGEHAPSSTVPFYWQRGWEYCLRTTLSDWFVPREKNTSPGKDTRVFRRML